MALSTTGPISFNDVNVELGLTATATLALGASSVRGLAGVASGPISLADLRGKANEITFTNTVQRVDASIFSLMGSPTAAGNYVFVNQANIYSTATFALRTGVFPAGSTLKIINQNYIRGKGGKGGSLYGSLYTTDPTPGEPGQAALYLDMPVSIVNAEGFIWGGGGGGGMLMYYTSGGFFTDLYGGGGGAGQLVGPGGTVFEYPDETTGNPGTLSAGGAGKEGTAYPGTRTSGNGGSPGAVGQTASDVAEDKPPSSVVGGVGGRAIQLNGKSITWISGNNTTRVKGAVS